MNDREEIISLLQSLQIIEEQLKTLIYGNIEIRTKNDCKYIYVHYREDGILLTKYAGEYSDNLYNLIINNTNKAKILKKQMKEINKRLKALNYQENELTEKVKDNIDYAKRNLVDTIYKQAMLEGVATTFADTEHIIEGGKINNMTSEDTMKIINLKHAWKFILNKNVILSETNYTLLCEINKMVEEGFYYQAGRLRTAPVIIGGTNWTPDFPLESIIKEDLNKIINSKISIVDRAIKLLLYVMKSQAFIDGNKRTAVIFCNHYLIKNGKGIISIPVEENDTFKSLLILYYEKNETKEMIKFIKEKCYMEL